MFFWCFNCSKITIPKQGLKCQYCLSQAIEEMQNQSSPAHYIPFSGPQQQTQSQEEVPHPEEIIFQQVFQILQPQRMFFTFPLIPTFSIIGIMRNGTGDSQRTSVADEKYQQLEKVNKISTECTVCQEGMGGGVKLGCKHEFHEDCIRPWFKNANTCPCCRATV